MIILQRYVWIVVVVFIITSCAALEQDKTVEKKTIALADKVQPKIQEDTLTVAFEQGFFEEIREGVEEIDLDELYASFENIPDEHLPVFSNEETKQQVNAMSGNVKIKYNPEIQQYINRLTSKRGRKYMSKMLALSRLYFPIFEKILLEEGVPQELKYAAVVESALIPNIMSRAGAVGLWQFMYFTGRKYGLEINANVDERCAILAATRASAKYMKTLYDTYGDWLMVLAAYNCGPGNVSKAIRRSGGGSDFWTIYKYLPRETRRHIPKYIAVFYAFYYHTDLMIAPMREMVKYEDVVAVEVDKPIHLEQVAKVLHLEEKDLAELNRAYLRGYIPAKTKKYALLLPANEARLFATYQDSIYKYDRRRYFASNGKYIAKKKKFYPAYGTIGAGRRITYRVRSGDFLGRIARRYGTTVRNIKRWNGLRSDRIRVGQRLVLYASGKYARRVSKTTGSKMRANSKNKKLPYLPEKYVYHTVKKNENCWSIAKKYQDVTQSSIMRLNEITNPNALRIGQKLRIKRKG